MVDMELRRNTWNGITNVHITIKSLDGLEYVVCYFKCCRQWSGALFLADVQHEGFTTTAQPWIKLKDHATTTSETVFLGPSEDIQTCTLTLTPLKSTTREHCTPSNGSRTGPEAQSSALCTLTTHTVSLCYTLPNLLLLLCWNEVKHSNC